MTENCTVSRDFVDELLADSDNATAEELACGLYKGCLDACEVEECEFEGETATDVAYKVIIQILVFMLVFGLAGSVDFGHFKQRFRSRGVYIGIMCQFLLMPAIGLITVAIFNSTLEPLYAVALILVCSSPGGSYSNWWCNLINADLALSVAMTTVSTIVSAVMLPVNTIIYIQVGYRALNPDSADNIVELLPYTVIGYTLANVIAAVILGLWFGVKYPSKMKTVNAIGSVAGFISIAMGVFASSTSCASPWEQPAAVYIGTLLPVVAGISLAMGLATCARLPKPQRVSVAIETGYQNTGISLAVMLSLNGPGRAAAIIPVAYGGWEAVIFGIYAVLAWAIGWTLSPKDEKFWKIIVNSYQDTIPGHPHYKGYHGDDDTDFADAKHVSPRVEAASSSNL